MSRQLASPDPRLGAAGLAVRSRRRRRRRLASPPSVNAPPCLHLGPVLPPACLVAGVSCVCLGLFLPALALSPPTLPGLRGRGDSAVVAAQDGQPPQLPRAGLSEDGNERRGK